MLKKIISKLDIHTFEVLTKSYKTMGVKIIGMIAGLSVSISLGRVLGTEGLGVVNFANKFGMILLILTMFGFQNVIIKFVAIAKGKLDDTGIATTLTTSLFFNVLLSIIIACLGVIILPFILDMWPGNQGLYIPIMIVFFMLIPQTISCIYCAVLNGYGKIWQAQLMDQTLNILFVGVGLILYWIFNLSFTPVSVLLLYAISRIFLALLVWFIWKKNFKKKFVWRLNLKPMLKMAKPLMLVTGAAVIANNSDIIILGILGTFNEVGIYSVAARLALLTTLFLQVTNAAIAPKLAKLFSDTKIDEMSIMIKRTTKGLTAIGFIFVLTFVVLGKWMLGFWGAEFQQGYILLVVLSIGQFFNIATGCSGLTLDMCGYEKIHGYISVISVILNIILNIILIIYYGALGAAIATATTVIFLNTIKVILAKQKTGILTIPF